MSPVSLCKVCGGDYSWSWEEAFDKFGFRDGDGQVMTEHVVEVLHEAGYEVENGKSGIHNDTIYSIKLRGVEQIPVGAKVGYDSPRRYLPRRIVRLLDEKLEGAR